METKGTHKTTKEKKMGRKTTSTIDVPRRSHAQTWPQSQQARLDQKVPVCSVLTTSLSQRSSLNL